MLQLFDMKKFQQNVHRELRRAYPDRRRLECQCLSAVAFVKSEPELLDCPIWVLIINVVAMDMLKSKLPPGTSSDNPLVSCILTIFYQMGFKVITAVNINMTVAPMTPRSKRLWNVNILSSTLRSFKFSPLKFTSRKVTGVTIFWCVFHLSPI